MLWLPNKSVCNPALATQDGQALALFTSLLRDDQRVPACLPSLSGWKESVEREWAWGVCVERGGMVRGWVIPGGWVTSFRGGTWPRGEGVEERRVFG